MDWEEKDTWLERRFEFQDFSEAFSFASRVALVAEKMNHHPEIRLNYNKLTLRLSTHDQGNRITDKDRSLAVAINQLLKS